MRYLLDTHLLIWIADRNLNPLLPDAARQIVISGDNDVLFSAASIWEIVIKGALGRSDFRIDAKMLRLGALASGFAELPITSAHTLAVADLPTIHKDPFDRLLVAQVRAEDITLLTRDETVAAYGANVILV